MKLYLVTDGSYSDYSVRGVFSTKERAEHAKLFYMADNDIEEWELDGLPEHPEGMFWFGVQMLQNGDTIEVNRQNGDYTHKDEWRPYGDDRSVSFEMWARDEQHAVKIANERRVRLIESNQWNADWDSWKQSRA